MVRLGLHPHPVHQRVTGPTREVCTFIVVKDSLFVFLKSSSCGRRDPTQKGGIPTLVFCSIYCICITFFSNIHPTNPHLLSYSGPLRAYLSCWAAAKYQCALMNKTRLRDSFIRSGEAEQQSRAGTFPGVTMVNLPLFLRSVLRPYRVFSREKEA